MSRAGSTRRRAGSADRLAWLAALLPGAAAPGCGGDSSTPVAGAGGDTVAAAGAGGVSGASGDAGSAGASSAGAAGASSAGAAGAMPTGEVPEQGVCGQRGQSPVTTTTSFEGFEELYLIADRGFGEDICVVRFDVVRVGDAPAGCEDCRWTHLVEYSTPTLVTDVDGVCENSELGLSAARIAEIEGSQAAYGYVFEYSGHNSVLLKYDADLDTWDPFGNATWDEETSAFRFDRRDGFCNY